MACAGYNSDTVVFGQFFERMHFSQGTGHAGADQGSVCHQQVRFVQRHAGAEARFTGVIANLKQHGVSGAAPEEVAQAIYRASSDGSRRFRYVPDRTARLLITLRQLMPPSVYRGLIGRSVEA